MHAPYVATRIETSVCGNGFRRIQTAIEKLLDAGLSREERALLSRRAISVPFVIYPAVEVQSLQNVTPLSPTKSPRLDDRPSHKVGKTSPVAHSPRCRSRDRSSCLRGVHHARISTIRPLAKAAGFLAFRRPSRLPRRRTRARIRSSTGRRRSCPSSPVASDELPDRLELKAIPTARDRHRPSSGAEGKTPNAP